MIRRSVGGWGRDRRSGEGKNEGDRGLHAETRRRREIGQTGRVGGGVLPKEDREE